MILKGQAMADCGLLALIAGSVVLIDILIKKGEARTREKLLEIEYRLAELSDQMSKK
jgi:hypothetical protein